MEKWSKLQIEWQEETEISFPRRISTQIHRRIQPQYMAMCAAVFIRIYHPYPSPAEIKLMFSKTKVKPIKSKRTIPQLELIAITMGTKALQFVQKHLNNLDIDPTLNLWSDFSVAISWINTKNHIRDLFVSNRIKNIHKIPI